MGNGPRVVCIPERLESADLEGLVTFVGPILDAADGDQALTLDFASHGFCDPAGAVVLGAAGARYYRNGKRKPGLASWDPSSYLARFGLRKLLGRGDGFSFGRKPQPDNFIGLREIVDARGRARVCEDVTQILHIDHQGAANLLSYALEEVLRNVDDHADSLTNACGAAPAATRLEQ